MAGENNAQIGVTGALSIGIGGIIGGGIFATLGLAGSEARGATFLAFLVGGSVALLTAYSYVRLSLAFPHAGGTVTFLNRAFGTGLFAGGLNALLVLSYVILLAVYAGAFASYAAALLPTLAADVGRQALAPGIIGLLALANLLVPERVARSSGFLNAAKLAILCLFVVAGLLSPTLTFERLGPADWVDPAKIVGSGMLVFLSYEGFELIANVSDRVRSPQRTLPLAYYGSIAVAMVLYTLIAVVTIGHLSFASLAAASDRSLAAAAETFLGASGGVLMAVGAMLATASAINADFFGASKLPVILAMAGQLPRRYERQIRGRYAAALGSIAILAAAIARYVDLHAISASASASFLLVFALVNVANAKLARETASRRWVSVLAAASCCLALGVLVMQISRQPEHVHALWLIAGVTVLPFAYEFAYRAIVAVRKIEGSEP